ncbi:hypothetical protein NKR23_g5820 [Pleurostoma richardsiae]|uniref:NmrA-like domain-containing protein n=1 Tax=Pleurostoma richardsiae TaxID=41990 RepID=A0AA38VEM3_9PEZI|nr:hypothetical protein NKR23_g5820 [Pleurostoma richardsiae]
MALPVLTVVGATGAQGLSVVSAFSNIKTKYHIRALTSDTSSATATRLAAQDDVSVIYADLGSVDSLLAAFKGSSLIFANTAFHPETFLTKGASAAQSREEQQGLNIVQAASQTTSLIHFVWSTLPNALSITKGDYLIPHFQAKIPAENFIRDPVNGLAGKTTLLRVGLYGSNLAMDPYKPLHVKTADKYLITFPCSADVAIPFIGDETVNVGLIVKAILSQPEKTFGRYVLGASEIMSCQDWAESFAKALRRQGHNSDAVFLECSLELFERIWGHVGTEIGVMFTYFRDIGYTGYEAEAGGSPILTPKDLGIEASLHSTEDRLATLDWSQDPPAST